MGERHRAGRVADSQRRGAVGESEGLSVLKQSKLGLMKRAESRGGAGTPPTTGIPVEREHFSTAEHDQIAKEINQNMKSFFVPHEKDQMKGGKNDLELRHAQRPTYASWIWGVGGCYAALCVRELEMMSFIDEQRG